MACFSCQNGTVFDEAGKPHPCIVCHPPKTTGRGRAMAVQEANNHLLAKQRKQAEKPQTKGKKT